MFTRLVALGTSLWLTASPIAPAAASQRGSQQASARIASHQQSQPSRRDAFLPPGRKVWDHPDEPGAWIAWESGCDPTARKPTGAAGALYDQWYKQLQAISALVRACPVFKDIRGYYPMLTGCVLPPGGTGIGPWDATVHLEIWPPVTVERTASGEPRVKSVWRYNGLGMLMIRVNAFGDLGASWFWGEDKEGRFFELPETRREIAGFPVIGDVLYLNAPGKAARFIPITQERAQRWIIDNLKRQADADSSGMASARRQYEEFISPEGHARRTKAIEDAAATFKKSEDQDAERRRMRTIDQRRENDLKAASIPRPGSPAANTAQRLTQLETRLAAMSTEERRQPAWYKRHPEGVLRLDYGDIVVAGTEGARPLVVPNRELFDLSLPKTSMQLAMTSPDDYKVASRDPKELSWRVYQAVIDQMDWRAVAALLK